MLDFSIVSYVWISDIGTQIIHLG